MGVGGGDDRLCVALGERFGESGTDEARVDVVDGPRHLGEALRRGGLGQRAEGRQVSKVVERSGTHFMSTT